MTAGEGVLILLSLLSTGMIAQVWFMLGGQQKSLETLENALKNHSQRIRKLEERNKL